MHKLKIDVTKIDKAHLFKGEKGTYLDCTLMENRDGPDQYGNDGFIVQDTSKEAREAGERGPIIGNFRILKRREPAKPAAPAPGQDQDEIPF